MRKSKKKVKEKGCWKGTNNYSAVFSMLTLIAEFTIRLIKTTFWVL